MNWIELKALHDLHLYKAVPKNQTLADSGEINYLVNSLAVLEETKRKLVASDGFEAVYQKQYSQRYGTYRSFLESHNLLKPQSRYELKDLDILMNIQSLMDSGTLDELRQQIIDADESLRGVSNMFFKNEKYLLNKPSLVDALKQILQIDHFSVEKDQQYMYRLECSEPRVIVLCENLDFLTKPNKPRKYGIELWYAGGKNIQKLNYADTRGLPIFYSCDWDFDGLTIYSWVRKIIPQIKLLYPSIAARNIVDTEHDSHWQELSDPDLLSGLPSGLFTTEQQALLRTLIQQNCWVIEEANDLLAMLTEAGVLLKD